MGLFDVDGKFAHVVSRIFDLVKLNLLCLIMCLPVITAGASLTAAWYNLLKMVRDEESYLGRGYWKAFKENFRQATIIWMILMTFFFIIRTDLAILRDAGAGIMPLRIMLLFIFFMLCLVGLYTFPILAKFDNTIKNTMRNAFLMAFRYLPYTFLMIMFFCAVPLLCVVNWEWFGYYILYMVLVGMTGPGYLSAILFRKIFDDLSGKTGTV